MFTLSKILLPKQIVDLDWYINPILGWRLLLI